MGLLSTTLLTLTFFFLVGPALSQMNGNEPYDLIPITSNNSQALSSSQPLPDDELFGPQPLPEDGGPNCQCVEYFQCNAAGSIITSGEGGLFDPRMNKVGRCPGVQVCCELREGKTLPATETVTPGSIQSPPTGSCGVRGGSLNPTMIRIFNDENVTEFGEFPWMLALLRGEETEDGSTQYILFQCGASLIHPQVAVTAAHCVSSHNKEEFKIRAGEWDTQAQTEPLPYQDRTVVQIIKHPQYYSGAFYNDIALLILDSAFTVTANVLPVCLPEQDAVFDGRRCFATGWGVGAFGRGVKIETTLRKVELPMISPADCQEQLRQTRLGSYFRLHDSFVCAGGQSGKDACQGDGGGPLVCQLPNATTYVQVGIISWGIGCGTNNIPGVYTNVARFRNWIDSSLKNML